MPKVLFVADKLSNETRSDQEVHPGGAELTDAAAIAACPWAIEPRRFSELDSSRLDPFDLIVVGNSQRASAAQLAAIAGTRRHVLFEHDVRICAYSGNFPAAGDFVHRSMQRCWCPHPHLAELFHSARGVVFLTERQRAVYALNPFFVMARHATLGCSLFSEPFFAQAERVAAQSRSERRGSCVVYSPNRIKGYAPSRRWALEQSRELCEIRAAAPERVLSCFAHCESFVYLPIGLEPAGRLPVEARLFGCDVIVNQNVGVAGEAWWRGERAEGLTWLRSAPARFWTIVEELCAREPEPSAPAAARSEPIGRVLDGLLRVTQRTRFLARPLPQSPATSRRARSIERYAHW
jgi:hypothetical protein